MGAMKGPAMIASFALCAAAHAQPASDAQGFSAERLGRIGAAMRSEIARGSMPGAVTVIARNGRIVHFEAHGFLDAARSRPMEKDALFRVFSMTKPVVSVAAMMLVETGELQLRDPVERWLPELKDMKVLVEKRDASGGFTHEAVAALRPITVYDLLRHTSGFSFGGNAPYRPLREAYEEADIAAIADLAPDEFVKRLGAIPLAWQPGTRWEYGNASTDVLGVLLERVTGKRLDALLEEAIFKPLGMKDTALQVTPERLPRLAEAESADALAAASWRWLRVEADPARRYRLAGAGMVSTAADFLRFAQMLLNGGELDGARLLSRKTVDHMLTDHTRDIAGAPELTGPGYGFGLGFAVRRSDGYGITAGSEGEATWPGFAGTDFIVDRKESIAAVFMSQTPALHGQARFLFRNLLYGALLR